MFTFRLDPPDAVPDPEPDDGDDAEIVVSDRGSNPSVFDLDVWEAMQHIDQCGHLLSFHMLPNLSQSSIIVAHVGDIAMPLGEAQARQIIAQAKQEPSDTIGYSNPWVLRPEQFELDSRVWQSPLQAWFKQVAPGIGCTAPVKATPHAMLLLEKGCWFDWRHYSEYVEGVFGHVVVYLPSENHEGGEIVINYHDQEKTVFDPNKKAQHFSSWFPPMKPRPVKSGYLWVLVFCLSTVGREIHPSAPLLRDHTRPIRLTLRRWLAQDVECRGRRAIYHPLKMKSKWSNLSLGALKFHDLTLVEILGELSQDLPFVIFLGHVEKVKERIENSGVYREKREGLRIKKLVGLNGSLVATDLHLDENHVPKGFFDGMKWKNMDGSSPEELIKGNMAFAVLVPCDAILPFFLRRGDPGYPLAVNCIPALLGYYARLCMSNPLSESYLATFKELCEFMWDSSDKERQGCSWEELKLQDTDLCDVFKATVELEWYSWFEKIAARHEGLLPLSFFGWVPQHIHYRIDNVEEWFKLVGKGLSAAVLAYRHPQFQVKALKAFFPLLTRDIHPVTLRPPEFLSSWARQVVKACIEACGSTNIRRKDGKALVESCLYFDDPFAVISQVQDKIDPGNQPDAFLGFMSELDVCGSRGDISQEKLQEAYRKASKAFIASTAFTQMHGTMDDENADVTRLTDMDMERFLWGDPMEETELDYYDVDSGDSGDERSNRHLDFEDLQLTEPREYEYDMNHFDDDDDDFRIQPIQELDLMEKRVHFGALVGWMKKIMEMSSREDDLFSLVVSRIVALALQLPGSEFKLLWLPFLKNSAPDDLIASILEKPKARNTLLWREWFSTLVNAYLNNYVGQWPQRPGLARPGVACRCADCKGLNVFLNSASLRVGRFAATRRRYQHIHAQMYTANVDYACKLGGSKSKTRMIVVKTGIKVARERKQWKERRSEASYQLGKLGQRSLSVMLGPEWMTFLSMTHLGGPGLSDKQMRTILSLKLSRADLTRQSISVFFEGFGDPDWAFNFQNSVNFQYAFIRQ